MGKIIKNDKVYSGTFDDATSVNYDNSVSGLNANSVQEGIDELADGLKNTSVVDNLLSTSTTLPLSANQGRVLDEKIGTINDSLSELTKTNFNSYKAMAKDQAYTLSSDAYFYISNGANGYIISPNGNSIGPLITENVLYVIKGMSIKRTGDGGAGYFLFD